MYNLICSIGITLMTSFAFGQGCEVEKDPFSNSEIISYRFGKYTAFEAKDNEVLLKYYFRFEGELNTIMPKGSIISFKFENDEMIDMPAVEDVHPVTQVASGQYGNTVWTEYVVTLTVSENQLKTFSSSKMTHVRYPDLKGDFLTKDRSKRWVKKFTEGARCIQSNLGK